MTLPDHIPFHDDRLQALLACVRSTQPHVSDSVKWDALAKIAVITDSMREIVHRCPNDETLSAACLVLIAKAERLRDFHLK